MAKKFISNLKELMEARVDTKIFLVNGIQLSGKIIYCDESLIVIANTKHGKTNINPLYIVSYS